MDKVNKENFFNAACQGVMHNQRVAFFISENNQAVWENTWALANTTPQQCALS